MAGLRDISYSDKSAKDIALQNRLANPNGVHTFGGMLAVNLVPQLLNLTTSIYSIASQNKDSESESTPDGNEEVNSTIEKLEDLVKNLGIENFNINSNDIMAEVANVEQDYRANNEKKMQELTDISQNGDPKLREALKDTESSISNLESNIKSLQALDNGVSSNTEIKNQINELNRRLENEKRTKEDLRTQIETSKTTAAENLKTLKNTIETNCKKLNNLAEKIKEETTIDYKLNDETKTFTKSVNQLNKLTKTNNSFGLHQTQNNNKEKVNIAKKIIDSYKDLKNPTKAQEQAYETACKILDQQTKKEIEDINNITGLKQIS